MVLLFQPITPTPDSPLVYATVEVPPNQTEPRQSIEEEKVIYERIDFGAKPNITDDTESDWLYICFTGMLNAI